MIKLKNLLGINIGDIVGECDKCGGNLIVKKGRFGLFIGCSNYHQKGCQCSYNYEHFTIRDSRKCSQNVQMAMNEYGQKILL